MSAPVLLALAVAGAAGAVLRFRLDAAVTARRGGVFPLGTLVVNLAGSLLLGVLAALVLDGGARPVLLVVLGTGFCGGFTTFSATSLATVTLAQDGRFALAAANALGTLFLTTLAAAGGLALVLR